MVKELLGRGANVEQQDERGRTALMLAAANGCTATVSVLMETGRATSVGARANNGCTRGVRGREEVARARAAARARRDTASRC